MRSEAQRRADAAYRQRHAEELRNKYAHISLSLPRDLAERFKAACAEQGTTVNAVLTNAAKEFVKK